MPELQVDKKKKRKKKQNKTKQNKKKRNKKEKKKQTKKCYIFKEGKEVDITAPSVFKNGSACTIQGF